MNILELQVRVVVNGMPESRPGPALQDETVEGLDLVSGIRPDVSALPDRSEADHNWPIGLS